MKLLIILVLTFLLSLCDKFKVALGPNVNTKTGWVHRLPGFEERDRGLTPKTVSLSRCEAGWGGEAAKTMVYLPIMD